MRFNLIVFLGMFLPGIVFASDVEMRLSVPERAYKLDEKVEFRIGFKNKSRNPIRLLPKTEVYLATVLSLKRIPDGAPAKMLTYFEVGIDFQQRSKGVVILKPNETYYRKIAADFTSSLPSYVHDKQPGLFLILDASALQLPGFGKYRAIAKYLSSADDPVRQYVRKKPALWEGEVHSNPVIVEFKEK